MTNNTTIQDDALKPFAKQANFYTGLITGYNYTHTLIYCRIDGFPDQTVTCIGTDAISINTNKRVVIMEIGGTYLVIARIT